MKVESPFLATSQDNLLTPSLSSQINLPHQKDVLVLGGGDDEESWIGKIATVIVGACIVVFCCPCIFLMCLYECFSSSESMVDKHLDRLLEFIEKKDPKSLSRVSKPEAYFTQVELSLKNIIFELKKLEEGLKNAPADQQEKLKTQLIDCFPRLGLNLLISEKVYQDLFFLCRKMVNKDPAECILSLIVKIKEDTLRDFDGNGLSYSELMALPKDYKEELGLFPTPTSTSNEDIFASSKAIVILDQCKELFKNKFTRKLLVNSLLTALNNEHDKTFYADYLKKELKKKVDNLSDNSEIDFDSYFRAFFDDSKFTKTASEYFIRLAFPSPLFNGLEEINWDMMKIVPPPIDFSKNDVSGIQLKELSEIWKRVRDFQSA